MASQLAMIEDTIVGLKRALAREKLGQDAYDEPISQPTNRGNKTRLNAKYVHQGSLGIMNGEDFYRKKVDHAGYARRILQYNPVRYDSEGDELDDDDSDATADAEAAEENPYSGISLETLLAPLKHPSELPEHPSMAEPYKSKAISHMVDLIDKRLRQERYALWQAKKVHRQLLGDTPWIPCGAVEKPQDRAIFEPAFLLPKDLQQLGSSLPDHNAHSNCHSSVAQPSHLDQGSSLDIEPNPRPQPLTNGPTTSEAFSREDCEMLDVLDDKDNEVDAQMEDVNPSQTDNSKTGVSESRDKPPGSGTEPIEIPGILIPDGENGQDLENKQDGDAKENDTSSPTQIPKAEMEIDDDPLDTAIADEESPEPPRRMTTRAQANQVTQQDGSQPPSPTVSGDTANASDIEPDDTTPHPLYRFPSIKIDGNCGLPVIEAEETRHLLWAYIQKQSETVRLFADILEMLRKSYRMKEDVFEWCKAEGHLGEMSDGEDWYDREKWGLEGEDLKKGADEEEQEVDEGRATGKRGRRRQ
ncbi:predicted protein [Uncinocarpus reesii 1704]|uniref:Transcriptional regulatory protein RXT2 N-terminal domain-containing protein n=1 Tax=Uncinocarpus reesii (strain UAMH 1704) TaxID=336963 RepID=C4JTE5_UNCRE|nr:uncharacterized protein UREG_05734 [Uncinocarpus reesii 1704]EEP80892.1 predicted protein [Uncinocarpus reesii 1704]